MILALRSCELKRQELHLACQRWTRWSATGVALLLAQAGIARAAHSQSAGSIGVQVQVVEAVDIVGAIKALRTDAADKAVRSDKAVRPVRADESALQPMAGRAMLVEVEPPRESRPGEARVQRVTVVIL